MSDEDRAESGSINLDALSIVLADHPSMVDDAPDLVALAQTLARAVDDDEGIGFCSECKRGGLTAALAGQYLKVLLELRGIGGGDEDGADDLATRAATAVGDPKN